MIAPISPTVPLYEDGLHSCPFCSQPIYIERTGSVMRLMRDEVSGRVMVA